MSITKEKVTNLFLGLIAIGFGVMTIKTGGFALFGGVEGKEFAGRYVPFVLWLNFIAGFFYVIVGIGIIIKKAWSLILAKILAITTILVFAGFGIHVLSGGDYEMRTVGALTVRSLFWIFISIVLMKISREKNL